MNWRASIRSLLTWRKAHTVCAVLLLTLLLLAFSLVALVSTETGTRLTIAAINAWSKSIHIQGPVHGRLIGPLQLASLRIELDDTTIRLDQINLRWHAHRLWGKVIDIDQSSVGQVQIIQKPMKPTAHKRPSNENTGSDANVNLPPAIRIQQLRIARFHWQDESNDIHLNQLVIQADNDTANQSFHLEVKDHNTNMVIQGHFNPNDPRQWQATLETKNLDLHMFSPSMHSELNTRIAITSKDHHRKVLIKQLDGNLNGVKVKGGGHITLGHPIQDNGKLWLDQGDNHIEVQTKQPEQCQWSIAIARLNQLWPLMHGSLTSQGRIETWHHQWRGHASIQAHQLIYKQTTWVNQLQARIQMINKTMLRLQLSAARHGQTVAIDSTQLMDEHTQSGTVQHLALALLPHKTWGLDAPIRWSHQGDHLAIQPFCMSLAEERICTELNWSNPSHLKFRLTTDHLQLHHFDPWLPPGSHLPGIITLNARAQQDGKDNPMDLHLKADVSPGVWQWALPYGMRRIDVHGIHLSIDTENKNLTGQLKAQLGKSEPLTASLHLPDFQWQHHPTQAIKGHLHWNGALQNIPLPEVNFINGRTVIDAQLSGTLAKPHTQGKMTIESGNFDIPALNTHWEKINGMIEMENQKLRGSLSGASGSGKVAVNITGTTGPNGHGKLSLKGHDMPMAMTDDYKIWLSPDLTLKWRQGYCWLDGLIEIPKGRITPKDFSDTTQVSSDVVFAGEKKPHNLMDRLSSDVRLTIGNDVLIKTHGVLGKLGGSLRIQQKEQAIEHARTDGTINLTEGQFSIYGQSLQIDHGALIYDDSPLDNPNLDIQASRAVKESAPINPNTPTVATNSATDLSNQINQITVGIRVTGTAKQPITTLYANPPGPSKSEILSYLVLGKGASQGDTGTLLNAITTLGLQGNNSNNLSEEIKRHSGMPNIQITSTETVNQDNTTSQNYAVAIGRYLSSKLYVSYSIGLIDPINTFKVTYLFNKKWSLQLMNSILGSGIDLLYSI